MENYLQNYPDMLTAKEVADIMRVDIKTVRNWVNSGELASIPIGKREYRISKVALLEFIENRQRDRGN
jgi:excisionase family DNA binding protein